MNLRFNSIPIETLICFASAWLIFVICEIWRKVHGTQLFLLSLFWCFNCNCIGPYMAREMHGIIFKTYTYKWHLKRHFQRCLKLWIWSKIGYILKWFPFGTPLPFSVPHFKNGSPFMHPLFMYDSPRIGYTMYTHINGNTVEV